MTVKVTAAAAKPPAGLRAVEREKAPYGTFSKKRQQTKILSRARMIAAAADVILDVGVRSVTVDAIVTRANVSRATFYLHFQSREDILQALKREMQGKCDARYRALADMPHITPHAVEAWLAGFIDMCREDRNIVTALFQSGQDIADILESRAYYESVIDCLALTIPRFAAARRAPHIKAKGLLLLMQIESILRYFVPLEPSSEERAVRAIVAGELFAFIRG